MEFDPLKYYGIDWLFFSLVVYHLYLLGNQVRATFLVAIVATVFGVVFGAMTGSVATMVMNAIFCGMHFRAYVMWGRKK